MDYSCTVENQKNWRKQSIVYVRRRQYDLATKEKALYETEYLAFNMRKLRRIGANLVRICFMVLLLLAAILLVFEIVASLSDEKMLGHTQEKNVQIEEDKKEKKVVVDQGQTYDTDELFIERCITECLTEDEVYQQAQGRGDVRILQFYINYIYALHGQAFEKGGEMARTFEAKEWYAQMKGKWRNVSYEELNSNEQHNVNIMVGLLEMEGYR